MNASFNVSMKRKDVLQLELEVLRCEHRDLDEAISALGEKPSSDSLTVQRLKKRKLGNEMAGRHARNTCFTSHPRC